jgi:hypothetical protein
MNYDEFVKSVIKWLEIALSDEYTVIKKSTLKNNGITVDSLVIKKGNGRDTLVSPCWKLEQLYSQYSNGTSFGELIETIVTSALDNSIQDPSKGKDILNEQVILHNTTYRLVNYKRNADILRTVPYVRFHDLALMFYVVESIEGIGDCMIMLTNDILKHFSISQKQLELVTPENTKKLLPADFLTIKSLINTIVPIYGDTEDNTRLWALTNTSRMYGAWYMTDPTTLEIVGKKLKDDFYILPSSVHECMITPVSLWNNPIELAEMVKAINKTAVSPEDFLSNSVYWYDRKERTVVDVN